MATAARSMRLTPSAPAERHEQSRLMSVVEAVTNVLVGCSIAVLAPLLVFSLFGLEATFVENLAIGGVVPGFDRPQLHAQTVVRDDQGGRVSTRGQRSKGLTIGGMKHLWMERIDLLEAGKL